MAQSIEITHLSLERLPSNQMTATMAQSSVSWFQLRVSVKNVSTTRQYVVADMQSIQHDSLRRTLLLRFSEQDLPKERSALDLPPPAQYLAVAPGEEVQISDRLSSSITFMNVTREGLKPSFVRIPEDVDALECTVAFGPEPPAQSVNLAALEPVPDTRTWGTTVVRSFPLRNSAPEPLA